MKDFLVILYVTKTGTFMTSYQHPLTQKRIRDTFKTREEAKEHKEKVEKKFTRRQFNNLMELNVGELLNLFMLEVPTNNLGKYCRHHLADFAQSFSTFAVEELTFDVLSVWLDQIQRENNLKNISMLKIKCDFDGFFKYLIGKEIISNSPLTEVFYARTTPSVAARNILSTVEIIGILEAVNEFSPGYLYPMIKLFAETGAKTTEVTDLNWKDIDLENKKIKFNKTLSSSERTLKMSDELANVLSKRKSKSGYVFVNVSGQPFTASRVARAITEFKVRSRYPKK